MSGKTLKTRLERQLEGSDIQECRGLASRQDVQESSDGEWLPRHTVTPFPSHTITSQVSVVLALTWQRHVGGNHGVSWRMAWSVYRSQPSVMMGYGEDLLREGDSRIHWVSGHLDQLDHCSEGSLGQC